MNSKYLSFTAMLTVFHFSGNNFKSSQPCLIASLFSKTLISPLHRRYSTLLPFGHSKGLESSILKTTIHFKIKPSNHGTIIRTGITCKKIPCYMRDSAYRWFIVENAKIFRSYVKHFWTFPRERNCRILIGLCKEVFMNHPIMFLDGDNKKS